jgi:hypothetical protein
VRDIGAVEALALLDEGLRPDHFFNWAEAHGNVEDGVSGSVAEPFVVDHGDAVARAVDDVDEVLAAVGLAQPVGEWDFCGVSRFSKRLECSCEVAWSDEDVQVLGVTLDTCVAPERVRPANKCV